MGSLQENEMLYLLRLIFLNFFVLFFLSGARNSHALAKDITPQGLNSEVTWLLEKVREDSKNTSLPVNKHAKEGQKAAQQTTNKFYSPEFQKKITCEQQRLEKKVFQNFIQPWKEKKPDKNKDQAEQAGHLAESEKIYLFLSSSMPDETIHAYLADIERVADPKLLPVTRGLVRGIHNRKAHTKYFSQILKKDLSCIDQRHPKEICQRLKVSISVNPLLFAKHNISRVPAVVYTNREKVFIIHGDAGFDYLLERINREVKSATLTSLIKNVQRGGR